jgi:hypothetical protein
MRLSRTPHIGTVLRPSALGAQFYFPMEAGMNRAQELRQNAENCTELAQTAESEPKKKRFERMAEGWNSAAENQAWLDGEEDKATASPRVAAR